MRPPLSEAYVPSNRFTSLLSLVNGQVDHSCGLHQPPIVLVGAPGCGKSLLLDVLVESTNQKHVTDVPLELKTLFVDDQTDTKGLLGTLSQGDSPGEFEWRAGIVTQAIRNGWWLCLESIQSCPNEILALLTDIATNRKIYISDIRETVECHPRFKLFGALTTPINPVVEGSRSALADDSGENLDDLLLPSILNVPRVAMEGSNLVCSSSSISVLGGFAAAVSSGNSRLNAWTPIFISEPPVSEWEQIWRAWSIGKGDLSSHLMSPVLLRWWMEVRARVFFGDDALVSAPGIRIPDGRDLKKWVQRIIRLASYSQHGSSSAVRAVLPFANIVTSPHNDGDSENPSVSVEAQKVFLRTTFHKFLPIIMRQLWICCYAHVPSTILGDQIKKTILEVFAPEGVDLDSVDNMFEFKESDGGMLEYMYQGVDDPGLFKSSADNRFALTAMSSMMLDRLQDCVVRNNEAVLLCGDTGTGKTTTVQHFARMHGRAIGSKSVDAASSIIEPSLMVYNFNEQSESADVLGRIVTSDPEYPYKMIRKRFLMLLLKVYGDLTKIKQQESADAPSELTRSFKECFASDEMLQREWSKQLRSRVRSSPADGDFSDLTVWADSLTRNPGWVGVYVYNIEKTLLLTPAGAGRCNWKGYFVKLVRFLKALLMTGDDKGNGEDNQMSKVNNARIVFKEYTAVLTTLKADIEALQVCHEVFLDRLEHVSEDPAAPRNCPLSFKFSDGILVNALKHGHWLVLDEVNLAPVDLIDRLSAIAAPEAADFAGNGQKKDESSDHGSILLFEDGGRVIKRHPDFRLFACMNPPITPTLERSTKDGVVTVEERLVVSAGKKTLPDLLRMKFTEFFVNEVLSIDALTDIVEVYLSSVVGAFRSQAQFHEVAVSVATFYLRAKQLTSDVSTGSIVLKDSLGNPMAYSLRTLSRSMRHTANCLSSKGVRETAIQTVTASLVAFFCTSLQPYLRKTFISIIESQGPLLDLDQQTRMFLDPEGAPSCSFIDNFDDDGFVEIEGFRIRKGLYFNKSTAQLALSKFIRTPTASSNLRSLTRIISGSRDPILLEGPTSAGKTSLVEFLCDVSGHKFVRINNHEHSDVQEYLGQFLPNENGQLIFQEGPLVTGARLGHWVVLDELNLAPSEVLEVMNRLLDDNRQIMVPESEELVTAHPDFMLFATQNPAGAEYGGRKQLSRALRSRFVEMPMPELPEDELVGIVEGRCVIPHSHAKKMVATFKKLRSPTASHASQSSIAMDVSKLMTVRDLLRWGSRWSRTITHDSLMEDLHALFSVDVRGGPQSSPGVEDRVNKRTSPSTASPQAEDDTKAIKKRNALRSSPPHGEEHRFACLAREGFILIGERVRCSETRKQVAKVIWESIVGKAKGVDGAHLDLLTYEIDKDDVLSTFIRAKDLALAVALADPDVFELPSCFDQDGTLLLNPHARRLLSISLRSILFNEPLLLVGETGTGKTTMIQVASWVIDTNRRARSRAITSSRNLTICNLHQHSEASDLLGGMRPCTTDENGKSQGCQFEWVDGPLTSCMRGGHWILLDEISLAQHSVLERFNSVFEDKKTLILTEKGATSQVARLTTTASPLVPSPKRQKGDHSRKIVTCQPTPSELQSTTAALLPYLKAQLASLGETDDASSERCLESITAHPRFSIVATMNPGTDYGKKELSPALRNRFTEVWVPSLEFDDQSLDSFFKKKILSGNSFCQPIRGSVLRSRIFLEDPLVCRGMKSLTVENFAEKSGLLIRLAIHEFNQGAKYPVTLREAMFVCSFLSNNLSSLTPPSSDLSSLISVSAALEVLVHGCAITLIDTMSLGNAWEPPDGVGIDDPIKAVSEILDRLIGNIFYDSKPLEGSCQRVLGGDGFRWVREYLSRSAASSSLVRLHPCHRYVDTLGYHFTVGPFGLPFHHSIQTHEDYHNHIGSGNLRKFIFEVEGTSRILGRVLRALCASRPLLLEGPPGVGKSTVIESLANHTGAILHRVNLSESTELGDLLGFIQPINGGEFGYVDGIVTTAVREGHWILLDEMNLAPQTVLEGLNSLLDHRQTLYLPDHPVEAKRLVSAAKGFQLFAAQNSQSLSGRKGLPQSLLNRFSRVAVDELTGEDQFIIIRELYSTSVIHAAITERFDASVYGAIVKSITSAVREIDETMKNIELHPWEWNMRDVKRIFDLANELWLSTSTPHSCPIEFVCRSFLTLLPIRCRSVEGRTALEVCLKKHVRAELGQVLPSQLTLDDSSQSTSDENEWDDLFLSGYQEMVATSEALANLPVPASASEWSHFDQLSAVVDCGKLDLKLSLSEQRRSLQLIMQLVQSIQRPVLITGPPLSGKTWMIQNLAKSLNKKLLTMPLSQNTDSSDLLGCFEQVKQSQQDQARLASPSFQWVNSQLVDAVTNGHYILMTHVENSSQAVLERLNSLLEETPTMLITESGEPRALKAHPDFRIFLTLSDGPAERNVSRALRNRCVEMRVNQPSHDLVSSVHCASTKGAVAMRSIRQDHAVSPLADILDPIFYAKKVFADGDSLRESYSQLCSFMHACLMGYADENLSNQEALFIPTSHLFAVERIVREGLGEDSVHYVPVLITTMSFYSLRLIVQTVAFSDYVGGRLPQVSEVLQAAVRELLLMFPRSSESSELDLKSLVRFPKSMCNTIVAHESTSKDPINIAECLLWSLQPYILPKSLALATTRGNDDSDATMITHYSLNFIVDCLGHLMTTHFEDDCIMVIRDKQGLSSTSLRPAAVSFTAASVPSFLSTVMTPKKAERLHRSLDLYRAGSSRLFNYEGFLFGVAISSKKKKKKMNSDESFDSVLASHSDLLDCLSSVHLMQDRDSTTAFDVLDPCHLTSIASAITALLVAEETKLESGDIDLDDLVVLYKWATRLMTLIKCSMISFLHSSPPTKSPRTGLLEESAVLRWRDQLTVVSISILEMVVHVIDSSDLVHSPTISTFGERCKSVLLNSSITVHCDQSEASSVSLLASSIRIDPELPTKSLTLISNVLCFLGESSLLVNEAFLKLGLSNRNPIAVMEFLNSNITENTALSDAAIWWISLPASAQYNLYTSFNWTDLSALHCLHSRGDCLESFKRIMKMSTLIHTAESSSAESASTLNQWIMDNFTKTYVGKPLPSITRGKDYEDRITALHGFNESVESEQSVQMGVLQEATRHILLSCICRHVEDAGVILWQLSCFSDDAAEVHQIIDSAKQSLHRALALMVHCTRQAPFLHIISDDAFGVARPLQTMLKLAVKTTALLLQSANITNMDELRNLVLSLKDKILSSALYLLDASASVYISFHGYNDPIAKFVKSTLPTASCDATRLPLASSWSLFLNDFSLFKWVFVRLLCSNAGVKYARELKDTLVVVQRLEVHCNEDAKADVTCRGFTETIIKSLTATPRRFIKTDGFEQRLESLYSLVERHDTLDSNTLEDDVIGLIASFIHLAIRPFDEILRARLRVSRRTRANIIEALKDVDDVAIRDSIVDAVYPASGSPGMNLDQACGDQRASLYQKSKLINSEFLLTCGLIDVSPSSSLCPGTNERIGPLDSCLQVDDEGEEKEEDDKKNNAPTRDNRLKPKVLIDLERKEMENMSKTKNLLEMHQSLTHRLRSTFNESIAVEDILSRHESYVIGLIQDIFAGLVLVYEDGGVQLSSVHIKPNSKNHWQSISQSIQQHSRFLMTTIRGVTADRILPELSSIFRILTMKILKHTHQLETSTCRRNNAENHRDCVALSHHILHSTFDASHSQNMNEITKVEFILDEAKLEDIVLEQEALLVNKHYKRVLRGQEVDCVRVVKVYYPSSSISNILKIPLDGPSAGTTSLVSIALLGLSHRLIHPNGSQWLSNVLLEIGYRLKKDRERDVAKESEKGKLLITEVMTKNSDVNFDEIKASREETRQEDVDSLFPMSSDVARQKIVDALSINVDDLSISAANNLDSARVADALDSDESDRELEGDDGEEGISILDVAVQKSRDITVSDRIVSTVHVDELIDKIMVLGRESLEGAPADTTTLSVDFARRCRSLSVFTMDSVLSLFSQESFKESCSRDDLALRWHQMVATRELSARLSPDSTFKDRIIHEEIKIRELLLQSDDEDDGEDVAEDEAVVETPYEQLSEEDQMKILNREKKRIERERARKVAFVSLKSKSKSSGGVSLHSDAASSFYSSSNPQIASDVWQSILAVEQKTLEILSGELHDDHEFLKRILLICRKMGKMPVVKTTPMALCTALEFLLGVCRKWDDDYGATSLDLKFESTVNGSSSVRLLEKIERQIIRLRSQELKEWRFLREFREDAFGRKGARGWVVDLLQTCFVASAPADGMEENEYAIALEIWQHLEKSLLTARVGEFDAMLSILHGVYAIMIQNNTNPSIALVAHVFKEFHQYAESWRPGISLVLHGGRKEMDKDFESFAKRVTWDLRSDVETLRKSIQDSHRILSKHTSKFDAVLGQRISEVVSVITTKREDLLSGFIDGLRSSLVQKVAEFVGEEDEEAGKDDEEDERKEAKRGMLKQAQSISTHYWTDSENAFKKAQLSVSEVRLQSGWWPEGKHTWRGIVDLIVFEIRRDMIMAAFSTTASKRGRLFAQLNRLKVDLELPESILAEVHNPADPSSNSAERLFRGLTHLDSPHPSIDSPPPPLLVSEGVVMDVFRTSVEFLMKCSKTRSFLAPVIKDHQPTVSIHLIQRTCDSKWTAICQMKAPNDKASSILSMYSRFVKNDLHPFQQSLHPTVLHLYNGACKMFNEPVEDENLMAFRKDFGSDIFQIATAVTQTMVQSAANMASVVDHASGILEIIQYGILVHPLVGQSVAASSLREVCLMESSKSCHPSASSFRSLLHDYLETWSSVRETLQAMHSGLYDDSEAILHATPDHSSSCPRAMTTDGETSEVMKEAIKKESKLRYTVGTILADLAPLLSSIRCHSGVQYGLNTLPAVPSMAMLTSIPVALSDEDECSSSIVTIRDWLKDMDRIYDRLDEMLEAALNVVSHIDLPIKVLLDSIREALVQLPHSSKDPSCMHSPPDPFTFISIDEWKNESSVMKRLRDACSHATTVGKFISKNMDRHRQLNQIDKDGSSGASFKIHLDWTERLKAQLETILNDWRQLDIKKLVASSAQVSGSSRFLSSLQTLSLRVSQGAENQLDITRLTITIWQCVIFLLKKGLCIEDDGDGDGGGEGQGCDFMSGTGVGEGEGINNVSDQIQDQDQVESMKHEEQNEGNKQPTGDEGVKVDLDFEGKEEVDKDHDKYDDDQEQEAEAEDGQVNLDDGGELEKKKNTKEEDDLEDDEDCDSEPEKELEQNEDITTTGMDALDKELLGEDEKDNGDDEGQPAENNEEDTPAPMEDNPDKPAPGEDEDDKNNFDLNVDPNKFRDLGDDDNEGGDISEDDNMNHEEGSVDEVDGSPDENDVEEGPDEGGDQNDVKEGSDEDEDCDQNDVKEGSDEDEGGDLKDVKDGVASDEEVDGGSAEHDDDNETCDIAHREQSDEYEHDQPVYGLPQEDDEKDQQLSSIQVPEMDDQKDDQNADDDSPKDQNEGPEAMTEENEAQGGGGMKGEKDEGSSRQAGNESSKIADETDKQTKPQSKTPTNPLDPVTATATELLDHLQKVDMKRNDDVLRTQEKDAQAEEEPSALDSKAEHEECDDGQKAQVDVSDVNQQDKKNNKTKSSIGEGKETITDPLADDDEDDEAQQVPEDDEEGDSIEADMRVKLVEINRRVEPHVALLVERLKMILEPTKRGGLIGDFVTGKRINLRKIIPFIASNYTKDKIWLRRTKPTKRDFQVTLAIDNTSSMASCASNALEALFTICHSLTRLEVGELCVLSFGNETETLVPLSPASFDNSVAMSLLEKLKFSPAAPKTSTTDTGGTRTLSPFDHALPELFSHIIDGADSFSDFSGGQASRLLIVLTDGRFNKAVVPPFVDGLKRRGIIPLMVCTDDSITKFRSISYSPAGKLRTTHYLEEFPFDHFVIVKSPEDLVPLLGDALQAWVGLVSDSA
eukprot:GHVH01009313.1.p1 GENE.GHVH01009313.1~~GHVH01009313.1.p1  ORF type:complete len:5962 (+),score=1014.85 GHVH01009313.1:48-17933(+)